MKRFLLITLSAVATLATITFSSCEADKCKATVCANGGNCDKGDGSCECPVGYTGDRCESLMRTPFIGTWTVTEDGTVSNIARYAVSVESGSGLPVNQVNIRNFNNQNNAVIVATILKDSILIPTQEFTVGQLTKTVVGYGVVEPGVYYGGQGSIRLYYRVTSSDGVRDDYGYHDNGQPSIWVK